MSRRWVGPRSRLRAAALEYAAAGVRVLPCAPLHKNPLVVGWPKLATTDLQQIEAWWRRHPDANIGLVTGPPGFDVLDIDVHHDGDGYDVLQVLQPSGLLAGAVGLVETPSGGAHIYFSGSGHAKSKLSGRHVDFQAVGGYVLAPPSRVVRASGVVGGYRWVDRAAPDMQGRPLDWPAVKRLIEKPSAVRVDGRSRRRGGPTHLASFVRSAPRGERNSRLFWAANRVLERGGDPSPLVSDATAAGLSQEEAEATVLSAIRTSGRAAWR